MRLNTLVVLLLTAAAGQAADDLTANARATLEKAAGYFTAKIACHGGYLWEYTPDLTQRWGEGKATAAQIWVQPPGTPSVGAALLRAYQATGDERYWKAARAAGEALIQGQLESGGWTYRIDFDPQQRKRFRYRKDGGEGEKAWNITTFDDDNTQSALRFLMALDAVKSDPALSEAVAYGLAGMLKAQYPKGGWPQGYPTTPGKYYSHYTFNDNTHADCVATLAQAWKQYKQDELLAAVKRAGDFIILVQNPPPQAGWAQQYDMDLKPAWARKFEPPSLTGNESAGIMRCLVEIYLLTGDEKYLKPVPPAIEWLKKSRLPDGQWARFYELGTNEPLYFTKDYQLTKSDGNCPTHYSFKGAYGVEAAIAFYEKVKKEGRDRILADRERKPTDKERAARHRALESPVQPIIAALDAEGRWITNGKIECATFNDNVQMLAEFLETAKP
jgi:PelA/Pel-15E family pectate lyase